METLKLKNITNLLLKIEQENRKSDPEGPQFTEGIIKDITDLGLIFQGYAAMQSPLKNAEAGLHVFIFEWPHPNKVIPQIPYWQDEGTNSFHYWWYGTLYFCLPIPY